IHLTFGLVNSADHVSADADHFPQEEFVLNDVQVVIEVSRRRHNVRQTGEIGNTTDLLEQLSVLEVLLQRDNIYSLTLIKHLGHRIKNRQAIDVITLQQQP